MKLSKLFWICKLGVLLFFILLILGLELDMPVLIVIGVVLLVGVFLAFQFKYRCPYCHKILDSKKLTPAKTCPRCGKNIENC